MPPRRPTSRTPDDLEAARLRALRLLARREHGARELEYKLAARGIAEERAAEVVEELARSGWQSDARYVSSLVRQRVEQGYGPLRIEAELAAAGVAESLIRETLSGCGADWKALAITIQERKFGQVPKSAAEWQKQYRHLAGRGFDAGQIRAALKGEGPEE